MEVTAKVYQITHRGVNIILIAEEELTLIDTGFRGSSPRIISFIHSLGRSVEDVSLIIITHNHLDHAGGLAELKKLTKAKVAIHRADISDEESQLPYRSIVDLQLEGGEVLSPLGGLRVIHTPGHTPGSISLFSPKKKLLIVGDTLNNRHQNLHLPPRMVSTDLTQAIDSVKRIAQLDFDILCFGHGKPLTNDASARVSDLIKKHGS
jgi:glyoxylase-like metal-dependent hydrolase (beta-lactamase superfamily II)